VPLAGGALAADELAADVVTAGVLATGADGAGALVVADAEGAAADDVGDEADGLLELEHPTKATDKSAEVPMARHGLVMPNCDRCMEFLSSTPAHRRLWSDDPGESSGMAIVDPYRRKVRADMARASKRCAACRSRAATSRSAAG
jgi:hypothetical protein